MNLKPETLAILKNFSSINKYMRINSGNSLIILNPSIPLFAIAKVNDVFPLTFSIYDIHQWLSTLSLFSDPDIDFQEKRMIIGGGRNSAIYRYSGPQTTADQPSKLPEVPETLFSFDFKKEQLQEILKASSVLGLKELEFSVNGIKAFNTDSNGKSTDNEYMTAIEGVETLIDNSKPAKIKIDALKLLPLDYKVEITEKAVIFTSDESSDIEIKYFAGLLVG